VQDAVKKARVMARAGGVAYIYEGTVMLNSGRWLWPIVKERVELEKVEDPLTRQGFITATEDLLEELLEIAAEASDRSVQALAEDLSDVDIGALTEAEASDLVERVAAAIESIPADDEFSRRTPATMGSTTRMVAGLAFGAASAGLIIPAVVGANARGIGRGAMPFIRDEYSRRGSRMREHAERVREQAVAQELTRLQARADMLIAARQAATARDEFYYRVSAAAAIGRARSFGQVTGYQAAGIPMYVWDAVMDSRTCSICRFLHGQEFPVSSAVLRFERASRATTPVQEIEEFRWYRIVGGQPTEDGPILGDIHVGGPRGGPPGPLVARETETGVGRNDQTGAFRRFADPSVAGGTVVPPAHGLCRCTTLPA
jgi:SPP1 gp7 family putative phage head morphogenesis protein